MANTSPRAIAWLFRGLNMRSATITTVVCVALSGCSLRMPLNPSYRPTGKLSHQIGSGLSVKLRVTDTRQFRALQRDQSYGLEFTEPEQGGQHKCLVRPSREIVEEGMARALRLAGYEVAQKCPIIYEVQMRSFETDRLHRYGVAFDVLVWSEQKLFVKRTIAATGAVTDFDVDTAGSGAQMIENGFIRYLTVAIERAVLDDALRGAIVSAHQWRGPHIAERSVPLRRDGVPSERWVVVIGINKYKDPRIPLLSVAEADAIETSRILAPESGRTASHTRLLLGADATQQNIRSALGTWLARKATKGDLVIIYYAGHGAPEADYSKKSSDGFAKYLVPYDAKADDLYATAIPMREIADVFDRIEAQRIIFLSDACYSGAAGGRSFSLGRFRGVRIGDPTAQLATGTGRVIITASGPNEPAVEDKKLGHGVFTHYLLEGLRGGAADKAGNVTLHGLYKYLADRVTRKSKEIGGNQRPVMKGEVRGDIILVPAERLQKAG